MKATMLRLFFISVCAGLLLPPFLHSQNTVSFNRQDLIVGGRPLSVASADFNGDGKPDLAVLSSTDTLSFITILLNNADGTLSVKNGFSTGLVSVWIISADVNADGKP